MPKAQKTKQRRTSITADPKRRRIRPFSALICLGLGLLFIVSLAFYHPSQNPRHTTDPVANEVVGIVGVGVADFQLILFGLASWMIPVLLLWLAYLFLFRRGYLVNSSRCSTAIMTVTALAGFLDFVGSRIWTGFASAFPGGHDYFQSYGLGGYFGQLLFADTVEPLLGAWMGGFLLLILALVCGTLAFTNRIQDFLLNFGTHIETWKKNRGRRIEAKRAQKKQDKLEKKQEKERLRREMLEEHKREKAEKKRKPKQQKPEAGETPPLAEKEETRPDLLAGVEGRGKNTDKTAKQPPPEPAPKPEPTPEPKPEPAVKPSSARKQPPPDLKIVAGEKAEKATDVIPVSAGNYTFPTLELLQEPAPISTESEQNHFEIAEALKETLAQFKIEVELGEIHTGPVITRYEVTPAAGVRVEKIASLDKNLAMNLRAEAVRILAPVPGRGVVGVEVPNQQPQSVCLRDIIETRDWVNAKSEIPIVLGKEVSGRPIIADLTKMPHLLIAGSTGSGKTVCINAIIASLLYSKTPADLRFIMVDPKIVEMQAYNVLPHMLIPVVTEPKKVPAALKWLLREMERRYQLFATLGVRNIAGFNAKILKNKEEAERAAAMDAELTPEERAATAHAEANPELELEIPKEKIPFIVCIVDELADLMMVAPADIETCIARLAQLARAAGIHLVIATQRPSSDVITGIIKANLPTRIAFKVASNIDSRVILDSKGAESLIGKGDMLFTPPGSTNMIRAQGAFVSDEEIAAIVGYIEEHNDPVQYAKSVQEQIENADQDSGGSGGGGDEEADGDEALLQEALQVLKTTQRASTSMLQRRLRIGYNRAARVMDMLEDRGIVGPENGSSPREILIDPESL